MANIGKSEKVDIRRNEILEHFQEVLKEEGFEGASMAKIAKKMGVNPSLLVHYFSTKEEMVVELVEFILDKYEMLVLDRTTEISTPRERLKAVLDMIFGFDWINQVDTSAYYACYYLSFRNKRVNERMKRMYQRFRSELSILLKICMDEEIVAREDPETLADFIICNIEGATFYRNISGDMEHYVKISKYLKQKIWNMLIKTEETVSIGSEQELQQFKKESVSLVNDMRGQLDNLKKNLVDL